MRKVIKWIVTAIFLSMLLPFLHLLFQANIQKLAQQEEWDTWLSRNWGSMMALASDLLSSVYFVGSLGLIAGTTGTLWVLEWFGPESRKTRPLFGFPEPTGFSNDYVEWGIPVVSKVDIQDCQVSLFTSEMPEIGNGIQLKWKTRDGNYAMTHLPKDVPICVAVIARKEPPSKDLKGGAVICGDNYYANQAPFPMIEAGKSGEFWIEINSGLKRWKSQVYLARVPKMGHTNGTLTVIPKFYKPH